MVKKSKKKIDQIITQQEFASRHGLTQPTVSRWLRDKVKHKRFKMYDAEVVEIAGKKFIRLK